MPWPVKLLEPISDERRRRAIRRLEEAVTEIVAINAEDQTSIPIIVDASVKVVSPCSRVIGADLSSELYRERRRRSRGFDPDLFGEPAWDILLDLHIQHCSARQVSVSSACLASNVPPTTALRWLGKLSDEGLIAIASSLRDRRLRIVSLTEKGWRTMENYLLDTAAARAC